MHACPQIDEAISYSLRQMSPAEQRHYQAHIASCPPCRHKLLEVAETLDLLPLALPAVDLPPQFKERLLIRVAAAAQSPEAQTAPAHTAPVRARRLLPAMGAAAAAVALLAASYGILRVSDVPIPGLQQAASVERSVQLVGTPNAQTATGRILVSREPTATRISLQAQGLPPLKGGEAYQLWLVKDGKRISGGVFVIDASGQGGMVNWLPAEAAEFDTLGVTREPDALGLQPRGQKVLGLST